MPSAVVQATNSFPSDLHLPRSAYLHQVDQIAPDDLIGREAELAELAEFCTSPSNSGRYLWWRAEAWSGKSALMSWFVLNPPAGTRIVSFFVTGRLGGQNDRTAFVDNVLEQLFSLVGENVPPLLTEATKHAHLLRLLDAAAAACRSRGECFVLVVDGLDEDSDAGGHSIASLLPVRPPNGMRVVVAGRPNPPADVPDNHPLRSGAADIRSLTPSAAATAMRRETEREIKALINGTGLDLLGLLCAAGGGLTAADLADLTEASCYEVEDHLRTVAGRSFTRRDNAYLLAHEELQVTAVEMLGTRVAGHRDRLHTWAETYRDQGWPESTPEYLLHGYAPMLRSLPDPARVVELVTDPERQARLLLRTGGDAAAHSEILAAQQVVAEHAPADLLAMTRLAAARGDLGARNGGLPVELPAVWELLGRPERAAALAHGIVDRNTRGEALSILTTAVAESGDLARAQETADSITEPRWRARAFTDLTLIATETGDGQRAALLLAKAQDATDGIGDTENRARARVHLARALDSLGYHHQASEMLDEAESYDVGDLALLTSELAACAEAIGDHKRAMRVVGAISDPFEKVTLLAEITAQALANSHTERAAVLLDHAEALATRIDDDVERVVAFAEICRSATGFGDRSSTLADQAVEEAAHVHGTRKRVEMLVALVDCSVSCGDLASAESSARMISEPAEAASALAKVAQHALAWGESDRADDLVAELASSLKYGHPLGELALYAVRRGECAHAKTLAERAETISREDHPYYRGNVSTDLASALCSLGWYDEAEEVAATVKSPSARASVLTDMLSSLSPAEEHERLFRLADTVEAIQLETTAAYKRSEIFLGLAKAMAGAAQAVAPINPQMAVEFSERAEVAARSVDPTDRRLLTAPPHDHEQARRLAERSGDPYFHQVALGLKAAAMAKAGLIGEAEVLTAGIEVGFLRDEATFEVATAVARTGELSLARQYVGRLSNGNEQASLLSELAVMAADAGEIAMARQFLMEALTTTEQWSRPLQALGRLDPHALREVAAMVLAGGS